MNPRFWLVPTSALLTAACAADLSCSAVGCSSGVTFTLGDVGRTPGQELIVHACVDDVCSDFTYVDQDVITLQLPDAAPRDAVASIRITQGRESLVNGTVSVHLTKVAPNGEECGPICYVADVDVTKDGLTAVR